jgi:hypothetical protein
MAADHQGFLTYDASDDGVWLRCSTEPLTGKVCAEIALGFSATVEDAMAAWKAHQHEAHPEQASGLPLCADCGHPLASHNDNGGRNKTAFCTVWHNPNPQDTRLPHRQCGCRIKTGA